MDGFYQPSLFGEKLCRGCDRVLSLDCFSRRGPGKLQALCRDCAAAYNRAHYAKNKEVRRQKDRIYRQNNKEQIRERKRRYAEANREAIAEKSREWRRLNPERSSEGVKAYRLANPDKVKQWDRNWKDRTPGWSSAKNQRRRALVANAEGDFTLEEWRLLCAAFGHRCACCGADEALSVDHVVPLSVGGTNWIANIQPLCVPCNCAKGTQTIDYRGDRVAGLFAS